MEKLPHALCDHCPLANEPLVPPYAPGGTELAFVGEAPGASEVQMGKPFVGPSGRLLEAIVSNAESAYAAIHRTNVVMCRPPANRTPSPQEVACCRPRLLAELAEAGIKRIVTLGKTAHEALIPNWTPSERGMWHSTSEYRIMPTWHPAYVLRKPSEGAALILDVTKALHPREMPTFTQADPECVVITSLTELEHVLESVPDDTWVAIDTETNQTQWYDSVTRKANSIVMLQLAWEHCRGFVLDDEMLYDVPGVITSLQKFFDRVRLVAHNGKFDAVFLSTLGLKIVLEFDTMLAHYCLDEMPPHGLKELVALEFGMPNYEDRLISQYLSNRNDEYSKIPFLQLAQYGVLDVVATLALRELYEERLRANGLYEWPFKNVLMRAANSFVEFEVRGIPIDVPYLQRSQRLFEQALISMVEDMRVKYHQPTLNPNSTQQMAHLLYDVLKLPVQYSKSGGRSTSHEALDALEGRHPLINDLLRYRRVAKMKSSYIDNVLEQVDSRGYVHPTVMIHGTETGRLSMRNPAMQTIPRPSDPNQPGYDVFLDGGVIRGAVIAPEGMVLIVADYSQAELRVLAALSGDPFLIKVYQDGRDLHSEVAIAMFGPNYTKEQRVRCKMFNFSWAYGGNEYSFAKDQGLSLEVARQFVRDYNVVMAGAVSWKAEQFKLAKTQGYVSTRFGRRRRFPLITSENVDEVRKASVNAPVQSSASDLTLLSALTLIEQHIMVCHLVHDSIIAMAPVNEATDIAETVARIMCRTGETWFPEVPWKVDVEISQRWVNPPQL